MTDWRESTDPDRLTAAIAALKDGIERAYFECRDGDAGDLHDDLVAAEWRLRQAKRRGNGK